MTLKTKLLLQWWVKSTYLALITITMKGTEVPNPRRSSACDCICVLTRNRSLSRDSPMLAMCIICSFPRNLMQNSLMSFWRSFTGLVQLIFSFPSWFHTIWFYYSHTFHSQTVFSRKLHSAFRLNRKTRSQRSHVFRLTGTAALHCGHTFVGGILTANGQ